jgi:hypothetical protein
VGTPTEVATANSTRLQCEQISLVQTIYLVSLPWRTTGERLSFYSTTIMWLTKSFYAIQPHQIHTRKYSFRSDHLRKPYFGIVQVLSHYGTIQLPNTVAISWSPWSALRSVRYERSSPHGKLLTPSLYRPFRTNSKSLEHTSCASRNYHVQAIPLLHYQTCNTRLPQKSFQKESY